MRLYINFNYSYYYFCNCRGKQIEESNKGYELIKDVISKNY